MRHRVTQKRPSHMRHRVTYTKCVHSRGQTLQMYVSFHMRHRVTQKRPRHLHRLSPRVHTLCVGLSSLWSCISFDSRGSPVQCSSTWVLHTHNLCTHKSAVPINKRVHTLCVGLSSLFLLFLLSLPPLSSPFLLFHLMRTVHCAQCTVEFCSILSHTGKKTRKSLDMVTLHGIALPHFTLQHNAAHVPTLRSGGLGSRPIFKKFNEP